MVSVFIIPASVLLATGLSSRGMNVLSDRHAVYIPMVATGVYAGQLFFRTTSRVLKIAQFAVICGVGLGTSVYFTDKFNKQQAQQQKQQQLNQIRAQSRIEQQQQLQQQQQQFDKQYGVPYNPDQLQQLKQQQQQLLEEPGNRTAIYKTSIKSPNQQQIIQGPKGTSGSSSSSGSGYTTKSHV